MRPVWIEFPGNPWGSIGWRIGWGEAYWKKWTEWYPKRSEHERDNYKNNWPEKAGWEGFYDYI